jgi:hypothetical protein
MALIPVQHVVADHFPVDPDWSYTVNGTIISGSLVDLDTSGYVRNVATAGNPPIGIAADNLTNTGGNTPFSANLTLGAGGSFTRSTENRVSDFFDETLASGRMTVYNAGGRFLTDQYVTTQTFAPSAVLYSTAAGLWTTTAGAGNVAGMCISGAASRPSGVPGTAVGGSTTLGTFIEVQLRH